MKTVFILGGSSDIGSVVAKQLLDKGYKLILHYNQGASKEFLSIKNNPGVFCIQNDLSYDLASEELIKCNHDVLKEVDIFINAASKMEPKDYYSITSKDIHEIIQTNFIPSIIFSQFFVPLMRKRSFGRILHLSSIGVKFAGGRLNYCYSLSKHMLEFIPHDYKEWAADNVLINILRVGVTNTKIHNLKGKDFFVNRVKKIPMLRAASAKEVAHSILNLSTEMNTFITGETITIAGGE